MSVKKPGTRQQLRAQVAHECISPRASDERLKKENVEYSQLAKRFPSLVHNCGLAQALAYIQANEKDENADIGKAYISHLTKVIGLDDVINLGELSRNADLKEYQRLTRETIESATWLKRYAEALLE